MEEVDVTGDKTTKFCLANWAAYSNTKAIMCNAGKKGYIFEGRYEEMTPDDVCKFFGALILDGLSPSMQVQNKMKLQSLDDVNGCNFIADAVGPNAEHIFKLFRHFFAVQVSVSTPPPR